jgi:hypothetical protein
MAQDETQKLLRNIRKDGTEINEILKSKNKETIGYIADVSHILLSLELQNSIEGTGDRHTIKLQKQLAATIDRLKETTFDSLVAAKASKFIAALEKLTAPQTEAEEAQKEDKK